MKLSFLPVLIMWLSAVVPVEAKVVGEEVSYSGDGITMKGYIAYDDSIKGKRPGVLVVHEWWGQNDYARKRARMLAELGYTAMAVDMFGDGKTTEHPKEAGEFAGMVRANMGGALRRFEAARETLSAHPTVNPAELAAIGYCFGGGIALEMARRGVGLKGVASFHGSLATGEPAKPGAIKGQILVMNGEADPLVKPEHIDAFKQEMKSAGASYEFVSYPDAMHAFTNPNATGFGKKFNLPLAYNKSADEKSWEKMKAFLKTIFS